MRPRTGSQGHPDAGTPLNVSATCVFQAHVSTTRPMLRRFFLIILLLSSGPVLPQQAQPDPADHDLTLTPATPRSMRTAWIVAPGGGAQRYNLFNIDTRAFAHGGILNIDIEIARNSGTDGSFDLFPAGFPIPTRGRPDGSLAGRYDVRRGTSTRLTYPFQQGRMLVFGVEGNWGSPRGATGLVRFTATVEGDSGLNDPERDTAQRVDLTPASTTARRVTSITAPGRGRHGYNTFFIDTTNFRTAGILDIQIQISPDSSTDGSFDLFPGNVPALGPGHPGGQPLVGKYDVRRGSGTRLQYRFQPGQTFVLGLEGNWFSPAGASGTVHFQVSAQP